MKHLYKKTVAFILAFTCCAVGLPAVGNNPAYNSVLINAKAADYFAGTYTINTPSGVKVWSETGGMGKYICAAPNGNSCYIEQINGEWGYTNSIQGWQGDNLITTAGWIPLKYCVCTIPNTPDINYNTDYSNVNKATINTPSGVKVWSEAGGTGKYICASPNGNSCYIDYTEGNWGHTSSIQGWQGDNLITTAGWIPLQYCILEYKPVITTEPPPPPTTTTTTTTTTIITTTTTPTTITTTTTTPAATDVQVVDFSKDIWNFLNTGKNFVPVEISDKYLNTLINNIPPSDISAVKKLLSKTEMSTKSNFKGVCYGMSVLQSLYKQGVMNPADYTKGASCLKEVDTPNDNEDVESLIMYYFLLQQTREIYALNQKNIMLSRQPAIMKNMLANLIESAAEVPETRKPVVVNYGWIDNSNNGEAHSVVAYGVEYGSWNVAPGYNGRLLIYDCSKGEFSDDACIYFKKDTCEWYVPYKRMKYTGESNCYATILFFSSNADILNKYGYLKANVSSDSEEVRLMPQIAVSDNDIGIRKTGGDDAFAINSVEMTENEDIFNGFGMLAGDGDNMLNYFMSDYDSGYTAVSTYDKQMNIEMRYEKEFAEVVADNAHKVTFLPDCTISLNGTATDYSIDITTDYELCTLPWYQLKIEGYTNSDVLIKQHEDGYILEGDIAYPVRITANNTNSGQVVKSIDLSGYSSVYITSGSGNILDVRVDNDGDNNFETSVLENICGDVNCDGRVDVFDFIISKRYFINRDGIININNLDMNNSGSFNISDLVIMQKYLLADNS